MADFKVRLASELITEQNPVSYRSFARLQKVHANIAKCMLYEFYEEQRKRKPGSIYATYLLSGLRKRSTLIDEDSSMRSSPPPTSSISQSQHKDAKTTTITLVREEDLKDVEKYYETISSIHIYSLSPAKIPDLMTLSDITRSLYTDVFAKEDPLSHTKDYGVIQNPQVRRRKSKRPAISMLQPKFLPVQEKAAAEETQQVVEKTASKGHSAPANDISTRTLKKESSLSHSFKKAETSSRESTPKPALKRDASDIFKAFAKSKTKSNDAAILDTDDGEEDATLFETKSTKRPGDVKKERDDKAAELRRMMDSDDEAEIEAEATADANKEPLEDTKDEDEDVAWSESDTEKNKPEIPVETDPKRKRGKRKVVKKRTMKDADGYLVTKEEEVWESYSESETEKPATKKFAGFSGKLPPKKAAAAGKKDIMSFFVKK